MIATDPDGLLRRKARLRAEVRQRRSQVPDQQRGAVAGTIGAHLRQLPQLRAAGAVLGYAAARHEVDLSGVLGTLLEQGTTVLLPRVVDRDLEVVAVTDLATLVVGFRGVLEPDGPAHDPTLVDVALVPGVAFDLRGGRLGHGGGHFDRLLPRLRPDALRIGVCWSGQVVTAVPRGGHDEPVDGLVTEDGVRWTGARPDGPPREG